MIKLAKIETIIKDSPGKVVLLLGNEAIARGAIESGVGVVTTYPGTPSSEIADVLSKAASRVGYYMEYSTNEKVAMEVAGTTAITGVRSFVCMKHVGLNVASDAFVSLCNTGVNAGFVVCSCDDPSMWSSQNEQDNRYYALITRVPMLEPSSPQEAKDMTVRAFGLSEQLEEPVLLRSTTRVSHTRGNVKLGALMKPKVKGRFKRDPRRYTLVPANTRLRHKVLLQNMSKAREISEETDLNFVEGDGEPGIVTSGISYAYTKEALEWLGQDAAILKLGMTHPLPENKIGKFLSGHKRVLVVEELEPYLEEHVRSVAKDESPETEVLGKRQGLFPRYYEMNVRRIVTGTAKALGLKPPFDFDELDEKFNSVKPLIPPRPPVLCPGCPHRASYYEIKVATRGKEPHVIYPNDIGCYTLAVQPPLEMADSCLCMGSSLGTACGFSQATDDTIVATIGDSTFFHAGIPGLINAVYNQHPFVLVVLDNRATAMTGMQPHPGTGLRGMGKPAPIVKIEDIARGCGVKFVKVTDPYNVKESIRVLREALKQDEVAVVVSRHKCALLEAREKRRKGVPTTPYRVNTEKCTGCMVCIDMFACPAMYKEGEKVRIEPNLCVGCGVCTEICPYKAIEKESS